MRSQAVQDRRRWWQMTIGWKGDGTGMWTQSSKSVQVMFVPRILKRQVAEADSLQDVGVNIHSGSCNRHTKNRNIKKDRKVESEDQERKWERTTIKKSGGCRPEGTQFVNYTRRCWWWLTQTESFLPKKRIEKKRILSISDVYTYICIATSPSSLSYIILSRVSGSVLRIDSRRFDRPLLLYFFVLPLFLSIEEWLLHGCLIIFDKLRLSSHCSMTGSANQLLRDPRSL